MGLGRPMNLLVAVLAGLAVTQLAIFATTVYLHRTLAHRAMRIDGRVAWWFRLLIWITTGMRPREWVAVHRRHHAHTDTEHDPHSPVRMGFWRVQLANAALYRRVARDEVSVPRYARDVAADRWDRILFDHAIPGLATGIAILCVTFGWRTGLVAAAVHAVTYLMLSGAVNAVGHTLGARPHANSATNGRLLALLAAGEGLHNNHHAAPTSARFALARGEVDPGWWLVRLLVRLRLAALRHGEPRLKHTA